MKITKKKYRCPICGKTGLKGVKGVKMHFNQKHSGKDVPDKENLSISSKNYEL